MIIILDAMGGDQAPEEIVAGAIKALVEFPDIEIVLSGVKDDIENELQKYKYQTKRISILEASETIGMGESPVRAIRKKKDSSIVKGLDYIKEGKASAFISAGNTGAAMAGSLFRLGRVSGIERPSILVNFPSLHGQTVVMDNGANSDCKSEHLLQFAIMGQIYTQQVLGIDKPRVGLLSIGEEKEKGNQLVKESFELFESDNRVINFIGNVEGRDIFNGSCDLVICDGFVGNVVLKTTEGVASFMFKLLKEAMTKNIRSKLGALLIRPYLKELVAKTDYRQYGGAPLLGVNGVVIISHGSSDATAIVNAIKVARDTAKADIINLIQKEIIKDGE